MYKLEMLLTDEDAAGLLAVTRNIGGSMDVGPRKMTDNLGKALRLAGVEELVSFEVDGTIYFHPRENETVGTTKISCEKV